MLEITMTMNGRKINPKDVGNAIEQAIMQSIIDSVRKEVGDMQCKEHGQYPKVELTGTKLDNLKVNVAGCCPAFIDTVTERLK